MPDEPPPEPATASTGPTLGADGGAASTAAGAGEGAPRPGRARHYRARHKRMRRWPRRVLIAANVAVFVLIAAAATVAGYASYELNRIGRVTILGLNPPGKAAPKAKGRAAKAFTMLIVGSDTRKLSKSTGLGIGSATQQSEALSDSIILARISPATHQVALLSIPRDLFVQIPGMGVQKINAAFSGGDPSRLVKVITTDLGIPIDHYAEINFDSFEQIADAIGGVEQYFPTPAVDYESGLEVPVAGCVDLKGAQALAFVRSRNYFYVINGQNYLQLSPESDLGRIQRQQAFIKDAIKKAERTGALTNPVTLSSIISSLAGNLTLDQTFSNSELITLAEDFSHLDANGIPNLTYPVVNSGNGLDRVPSADAAVVAEFENLGATSPAKTTRTPHRVRTTTPATTSPGTTVAPASVSVQVENGSGASGQAGLAATDLEHAGFTVSGSSDAAAFTYRANVIDYGPAGLAAAQTLRATLSGGATLTTDPALTGSDLILVTGSAFAGTTGEPPGTSTTTPSTTVPSTTTTLPAYGTAYSSGTKIVASSSSYYDGVYIPPGRVPGQAVSTCGN